jgi:hypothetical protein
LPEGQQLSLADCYTVLAAIHDATLKGVEHINPWMAAKESMPPAFGAWYHGLPDKAKELSESDAASLWVILRTVEEDLQGRKEDKATPTKVAKKRGGPGRQPVGDKAAEKHFFDAWKASDLPLKDFARTRGVKIDEAEKLTARERTRRNRERLTKLAESRRT